MVAAAMVASAVVGGVASNAASNKASKATKGASDAAATQAAIAQDQWDTYKKTYQPLEQDIVAGAMAYDSAGAREEAAGLASTTVSQQFGKARERLARTPGLDPSSGAYMASLADLDRTQAATDATSQNAARKQVEDTAYARKLDAVSLGKGLPAQASTGFASSASLNGQIANQQNGMAAQIGSSVGGLASSVFNNWPSSTSTAGLSSAPMQLQDVSAQQTLPTQDLSGISWL